MGKIGRDMSKYNETRSCLICGTIFTAPISRKKLYCSRDCYFKSMVGRDVLESTGKKISESKLGKKHPQWRIEINRECHKGILPSQETKIKRGLAIKEAFKNSVVKQRLIDSHKGIIFTDERRKNISESQIGKVVSTITRDRIGKANTGKTRTEEFKRLRSESQRGEKSPLWKGGASFIPYCFKFNRRRKVATRKFFDYYCLVCGMHVTENIVHWKGGYKQVDLHVHHVDHNKNQGCTGVPFNLVPLCQLCHLTERHHEEEYRTYINRTLSEGFKWGIWSEQEYIEQVMYPE